MDLGAWQVKGGRQALQVRLGDGQWGLEGQRCGRDVCELCSVGRSDAEARPPLPPEMPGESNMVY